MRLVREWSTSEEHIMEYSTHYIGKSGKEYSMDEYVNHGYGGVKNGYKDLPHDDYPYTYNRIRKKIR